MKNCKNNRCKNSTKRKVGCWDGCDKNGNRCYGEVYECDEEECDRLDDNSILGSWKKIDLDELYRLINELQTF